MNKIQTIVATGIHNWTAKIPVGDHDIPLTFTLFGATFPDGSKVKEITPDSSKLYELVLSAEAPTDDKIVHHAVVQYDDDGQNVLVQEACRNIVCPVRATIDFRVQTKGFEALPLGKVPSSGINAILKQESEITEFDPADYTAIDSLPTGTLAFDQAITIFYDRAKKTRYWLSDIHTDPKIVKKDVLDLCDSIMRYHPDTKMRQIIDVYKSGQLDVYAISATPTKVNLPFRPTRVVVRGTDLLMIDTAGKLHTLDTQFQITDTREDHFYTSVSNKHDLALTRAGKLVGDNVDVANNSGMFFYQFGDSSDLVYGYEPTSHTTIQVFDYVAQTLTPRSAMTPQNVLAYRVQSSVSENGAVLNLGPDYVPATEQIFLGVTSNPYENEIADRRLGYFFNDVQDLTHITVPKYESVLPDFDTELGPEVVTEFVVDAEDPDMALPITLPESATWTAIVNGQEVQTARKGDRVKLTVQSPDLTLGAFPFSVGRTSGLIEIIPDSMPDPFTFVSVHDQPENFWYKTEIVTVTGINVRVPVSILINEEIDYSRVKIFVNGVEKQMPVYMFNNDTLQLEVRHDEFQTRVEVTVGDYTTKFGVFTIDELPLPALTNWCYVPAGKEIISDLIKNDSPADLDLTITSDNATFSNGKTVIKLAPNQSTQIKTTAEKNTKKVVTYKTVIYTYKWNVWSHEDWLDDMPAGQRAESMHFSESAPIVFTSIPVTAESKWKTILRVPAGILLTVGTDLIEHELDSRSVYATPFEQEIDVQDLEIGAYPRTSPYLIGVGDAEIQWQYLFDADPTYEQGTVNVQTFANVFKYAFRHAVITTKQSAISAFRYVVSAFAQQHKQAMILAHTISQNFENVDIRIATFDQAFAQPKLSYKFFTQKHGQHLLSYKYFKQKTEFRTPISPRYFDAAVPRYLHDTEHWFGEQVFAYVGQISGASIGMYGADYITQSVNHSDQNIDPVYRTYTTWTAGRGQVPNFTRHDWYYIGRDQNWKRQTNTIYWSERSANYANLLYAYNIDMHVRYMKYADSNKVKFVPRWITNTAEVERWLKIYANVTPQIHRYGIERAGNNIRFETHYWIPRGERYRYVPVTVHVLSDTLKPRDVTEIVHRIGYKYPPVYVVKPVYPVTEENRAKYVWTNVVQSELKVIPQFITGFSTNVPMDNLPRHVDQDPGMVTVSQKKSAKAMVVLPIKNRRFTAPMDELSEGQTDPLENGYFATEQLALRNAVTVWGHDPSTVKAAQRPDGTWYWVREIPCDNSCGAYSCDMRGYISGG